MTLDDLVKNPELVTELPRAALVELHRQAGILQANLFAMLLATAGASQGSEAHEELLDVKKAAARMGVSTDYLYRHPELPFTVRIGRHVKYSSSGLDRWIRSEAGRR